MSVAALTQLKRSFCTSLQQIRKFGGTFGCITLIYRTLYLFVGLSTQTESANLIRILAQNVKKVHAKEAQVHGHILSHTSPSIHLVLTECLGLGDGCTNL